MADSLIQTVTAPQLYGLWAHDPSSVANAATTERNWLYTDGGTQKVEVDETLLRPVGRRYPVLETGTTENESVQMVVTIPHGPTRLVDVDWWLARKRAAKPLMFRDGRGRAFKAVIYGDVSIAAEKVGSLVGVTFQRVDYPVAATLAASDYQTGVADDGGKGDGAKGFRGKGL